MAFNYGLPYFGQKITVETPSGEKIKGALAGLHCESGIDNCVLQLENGARATYPLKSIKELVFNFGTFEDVIYHLSQGGDARHCPSCYLSMLYALDLLANKYKSQHFLSRSDLIKKGLLSFLSGDFSQSASSLIPQLEGIVNGVLHDEGLIKETKGFPVWTKEHPDNKYHGEKCTNLVKQLEGAKDAKGASKLEKFLGLSMIEIEKIRGARNKIMHGKPTEVSEHEMSSVIFLLHALYHVTQLDIEFGK